MNEWPKQSASASEGIPALISDFTDTLSEHVEDKISLENVGGTYEIEAERFSLTFTVEGSVFEIRSIDTRGSDGMGRRIIDAIHEFADESRLEVQASNVRDEAQGFWKKMGYEEGTAPEEYFRV